MKFSYNWLTDLVDGLDAAPNASPQDIERLITIHTAESEGLEQVSGDWVVEVDNKSLTHRPDLWGHYGMAREVAAMLDLPLKDPVPSAEFPGDPLVKVTIEDRELCPRYSALVMEGVKVEPSPAWLRERLEAVEIHSVNNIVDVTNWVLAEIAQPMHAFDADKLTGGEIIVRSARTGETIEGLNAESYDLDPSNLVIADPSGPVAVAGVIGGMPSSITESTTRIVLESANFNATSVRKTSSSLRLRTDASQRFEKSQDPVNTIRGLQLAVQLIQKLCPGSKVVGGLADAGAAFPPAAPIDLPLDWLNRKLGAPIPAERVRKILEALEFGVEESAPGHFKVSVPSWRATKDISLKEDLVEEVGRMVGYDSITPTAPLIPAAVPPASPTREFHHQVRLMTAAQGFTEVYNYSFVSTEMVEAFGLDPAQHVHVANPIVSDQNMLRTSLLPGIRKNIADNTRHFDQFRLFEIGREVHLDHESPKLVAAIFTRTEKGGDEGRANLLELKRLSECLAAGVAVRPSSEPRSFEHPSRAADLVLGDAVLGRLFEFHPGMIEDGRAAVLELDLTQLEASQSGSMHYKKLRRFPASAFDLSVVAQPRALIGEVQAALAKQARDALVSIRFLRDFQLEGGQRSLSYRLTIGAADHTLSAEEVTQVRDQVIDGMRSEGYELRV